MRVLLVEDDEMIGQSLRDALDANGWSVDWVKDGLLAQSALDDGDYACVLLDLGLPKVDGTEVLRKARSSGNQTPVPFVTVRLPDKKVAAEPCRRQLVCFPRKGELATS